MGWRGRGAVAPVRGGLGEVEGEVADDGHVGCAVALAQPGLVFAEIDVEHPVQPILDAPVAARRLGGAFGGSGREAI